MRKKASGFYADSLEMLLDTMCNVLGGILFITLTLAVLTHDRSTPASNQSQMARLTSELSSLTSSNAAVQAGIEEAQLQLQARPVAATNQMRLPNVRGARRKPWPVVMANGQLFSVFLFTSESRARLVKNTSSIRWRGSEFWPKQGVGDEPETGVDHLIQQFRTTGQTNYYFTFLVYADSFDAFHRAREIVSTQGMECGWEPMQLGEPLRTGGNGDAILPQN